MQEQEVLAREVIMVRLGSPRWVVRSGQRHLVHWQGVLLRWWERLLVVLAVVVVWVAVREVGREVR